MLTRCKPLKRPERGFVVAQLVHQGGYQYRGVEQRAHSANGPGNPGVAHFPFSADEIADVQGRFDRPMVHENATLANKSWFGICSA